VEVDWSWGSWWTTTSGEGGVRGSEPSATSSRPPRSHPVGAGPARYGVRHPGGLSGVVLRHRRSQGWPGPDLAICFFGHHRVGGGLRCHGLDSRRPEPATRVRDRASIGPILAGLETGPHPSYDHLASHAEPLLWAADGLCWAVGAGGDRRRTDVPRVGVPPSRLEPRASGGHRVNHPSSPTPVVAGLSIRPPPLRNRRSGPVREHRPFCCPGGLSNIYQTRARQLLTEV